MSAITDDAIGQRLWDDAKAQALGTADLAGLGPDQKKYTPEEVDLMFMAEADGWTVDKELALLAEGKSREEIGALKYPHRENLAQSDGRALSKYAQAKWMADQAQKADPTWKPPLPPGAAPPAPTGSLPTPADTHRQFADSLPTSTPPTSPPPQPGGFSMPPTIGG